MFSFFPILFAAAGVSAAYGPADGPVPWSGLISSSTISTISTSSSWTPWQQAVSAPSTFITVTCSKRENETTSACSPTMASTSTPSPFVSSACSKAENATVSACSTIVVPSTTSVIRTVGALPPSTSTTTLPLPGGVQATSTSLVVGAPSPLATFTIVEQGSSNIAAGSSLSFTSNGDAQFDTSNKQFYIDSSGYLHESTTGWAANYDPSVSSSYSYLSFTDMNQINQSPEYYKICTANIDSTTSVLTLNCGGFTVVGVGCSTCQVLIASSLPGGIPPVTLLTAAV